VPVGALVSRGRTSHLARVFALAAQLALASGRPLAEHVAEARRILESPVEA